MAKSQASQSTEPVQPTESANAPVSDPMVIAPEDVVDSAALADGESEPGREESEPVVESMVPENVDESDPMIRFYAIAAKAEGLVIAKRLTPAWLDHLRRKQPVLYTLAEIEKFEADLAAFD